jgi:hypothetical protein
VKQKKRCLNKHNDQEKETHKSNNENRLHLFAPPIGIAMSRVMKENKKTFKKQSK